MSEDYEERAREYASNFDSILETAYGCYMESHKQLQAIRAKKTVIQNLRSRLFGYLTPEENMVNYMNERNLEEIHQIDRERNRFLEAFPEYDTYEFLEQVVEKK